MATRPDELVDLTTAPNEPAAAVIKSVLEDNEIDSILVSAPLAVTAFFGNAVVPTIVRVRQEDLERAKQVLDQNREDSVDLDWEDVDVGDPEDPLAAAIAGRADHTWTRPDVSPHQVAVFSLIVALVLSAVAVIIGVVGVPAAGIGIFWAALFFFGLSGLHFWRSQRSRKRRNPADSVFPPR